MADAAAATGNQAFADAAAAAKQLSYNPSNDELLTLYGYFKQGTVGDNATERPGLFDLQGKAKWDAWTKNKGLSKEEAQAKYIEFVKSLQAK
ncbi:UNVERIFIED_CONTAM: Acyl-CoA-binding domain-containing protein 1 [Siphonaria sp. JEL0065]|nr:Acyl-CoA-binding domain-containing protein 1 [Siphonaria sp. JEL0065]